jgi:hypothetical protein
VQKKLKNININININKKNEKNEKKKRRAMTAATETMASLAPSTPARSQPAVPSWIAMEKASTRQIRLLNPLKQSRRFKRAKINNNRLL